VSGGGDAGGRWLQHDATLAPTPPPTWEQARRATCGALAEPGRYCNNPGARVRPPNTIPTCDAHAGHRIGTVDRRFDPPVCDFCLAPDPDDDAVLYVVHGFTIQLDPDDRRRDVRHPPQRYAACPACRAAIEAHDLDALVRRHLEARDARQALSRWPTYASRRQRGRPSGPSCNSSTSTARPSQPGRTPADLTHN
jgi:hypothetical protein